MKFLDQAKIYISSGKGGAGSISFRREKYIQHGGPDGGDGGSGGHVFAECVDGLNTLIDYRYQQHFKGKTGGHGMGRNRHGANGDDCIVKVPVGTQIYYEDNETLIADFTKIGQKVRIARGGNGGFGNAYFKSAINQAPRRANPGEDGEEMTIWLRLKLIADAGLVGLPNAGKSTFLIEGAHEGVGIGDRFLGHIERCATNLHLVDGTADDVAESYRIVRGELDAYANGLEEKPELVALTKVDALSDDEIKAKTKELEAACNSKVLPLSAPTRKGVDDVLRALMDAITDKRDAERAANEPESEGWSPV